MESETIWVLLSTFFFGGIFWYVLYLLLYGGNKKSQEEYQRKQVLYKGVLLAKRKGKELKVGRRVFYREREGEVYEDFRYPRGVVLRFGTDIVLVAPHEMEGLEIYK